MKILTKILIIKVFILSLSNYAQSLTIKNETSLTVLSESGFFVDGLAIKPSEDGNLTINGPTSFSRSSEPIGESIDRVFNFSSPITNFQGELTFYYNESELTATSANETDLVLHLYDGTNWSGEIIPTRDPVNNSLKTSISSLTTLSSLTASKSGITLSISKYNKLAITIFPNPVISELQVSTNLEIESLIYNALGQEVLKTTNKNIDVSQLSTGNYLVIIKDLTNNNFNSYHIIKL